MSTIFGIAGINSKIDKDTLYAIRDKTAYWESDEDLAWVDDSIALGAHVFKAQTKFISKKDISPQQQSSLYVVNDSRLDYKDELGEKMSLSQQEISCCSDSQLIIKAFEFWGKDCVEHLYGDFSFVIWDVKRKELFCARDHFGIRPFYYVLSHGQFFFSTDIRGLVQTKAISSKIKDSAIIDCLMGISSPKEESGFDNILKLKPGHSLLLDQSGNVTITKYWDLKNTEEISTIKEVEASKELKERFINAVKQRIDSENPIGFELSGGLDSSSTTAIGARLLKDKSRLINVFSQVLPDDQINVVFPFLDEVKYSQAIVDFCNIENRFLLTSKNEGALEAIERQVLTLSATVGQTIPFMMDKLYDEVSNQGIEIVISGFGGDEGVTSRASGFFEDLVCKREWAYLKAQLKQKIQLNGGSFRRSLVKYYLFRISPYSFNLLRLLGILPDYRRAFYKHSPLDKDIKRIFNTRRRFMKHSQHPNDCILRNRQYRSLMSDQLVNRIENTYHFTKANRIEYRYPFLDVKLVEYYYSLPAVVKYKNGYGRYIFRKAIEGEIPNQICWRNDKSGASVPNSLYRCLLDIKAFEDLIEDGRRNNRFHFVDYDKMKDMIDDLVKLSKGLHVQYGPRLFYSAIRILIMQKWQREGKINIGIKC